MKRKTLLIVAFLFCLITEVSEAQVSWTTVLMEEKKVCESSSGCIVEVSQFYGMVENWVLTVTCSSNGVESTYGYFGNGIYTGTFCNGRSIFD